MPVFESQSLGKEQAWAIWHIQESEEELSFKAQQSCPDEIIFPEKRLEWLAGRALIRSLTEDCGLEYLGLRKDEFGKPFLKEHPHQISLSHSFPYVAAQIDRHQPVGIDLEQPKEKLRKIASRIFNPDEVKDAGDDLTKLCIYWCAKEALYKLYGKRSLLFSDHLRVQPFVLSQSGDLMGTIQLPENSIPIPIPIAIGTIGIRLQYLVMEDFVMVNTGV